MSPLILAVVAFASSILMMANLKRRQTWRGDMPWTLSVSEWNAYQQLCRAFPDSIVLVQIDLAHIVGVKKAGFFSRWMSGPKSKNLDFIICGRDATVLAVVEIENVSVDSLQLQLENYEKNRDWRTAGLHVEHWQIQSMPDEASIRAAFPELTPDYLISSAAANEGNSWDAPRKLVSA